MNGWIFQVEVDDQKYGVGCSFALEFFSEAMSVWTIEYRYDQCRSYLNTSGARKAVYTAKRAPNAHSQRDSGQGWKPGQISDVFDLLTIANSTKWMISNQYPYGVLEVSNWCCFFLYMLSLTIQSNLWHWNRQSRRRTWVLVRTQGDIGWPGSSTAKIYIHIMILVLFSSISKVSIIFWVITFSFKPMWLPYLENLCMVVY